jgi:hypothetical protein
MAATKMVRKLDVYVPTAVVWDIISRNNSWGAASYLVVQMGDSTGRGWHEEALTLRLSAQILSLRALAPPPVRLCRLSQA